MEMAGVHGRGLCRHLYQAVLATCPPNRHLHHVRLESGDRPQPSSSQLIH
jgi:hypothetical protein